MTDLDPFVMTIGDSVNGFPGTRGITIQCLASGVPAPSITWSKDGQVIQRGSRHVVDLLGSLVILKTVKEDSGRYTCLATNLVGKDSADALVNMLSM